MFFHAAFCGLPYAYTVFIAACIYHSHALRQRMAAGDHKPSIMPCLIRVALGNADRLSLRSMLRRGYAGRALALYAGFGWWRFAAGEQPGMVGFGAHCGKTDITVLPHLPLLSTDSTQLYPSPLLFTFNQRLPYHLPDRAAHLPTTASRSPTPLPTERWLTS